MSESKGAPSGSKSRSPWLWVGLGCGLSVLLTFGGCIAFLGIVGTQVSKEMAKPINSAEVIAQLGDVPVYKPSTFNEPMTKAFRAGTSMVPGQMLSAAAFEITDEPNQVFAWYEKRLKALGYQKSTNAQIDPSGQIMFEKQSNAVLVQIQKSVTEPKGNSLLLMRMKTAAGKPKQ